MRVHFGNWSICLEFKRLILTVGFKGIIYDHPDYAWSLDNRGFKVWK
jgi:hypothetical protein